jgi:hypothetical protein
MGEGGSFSPPSALKFGRRGDLSPAFRPPVQPSSLPSAKASRHLRLRLRFIPLFFIPQPSSLVAAAAFGIS